MKKKEYRLRRDGCGDWVIQCRGLFWIWWQVHDTVDKNHENAKKELAKFIADEERNQIEEEKAQKIEKQESKMVYQMADAAQDLSKDMRIQTLEREVKRLNEEVESYRKIYE